jgi:cobalt-zinc-cadmium efflux system protein
MGHHHHHGCNHSHDHHHAPDSFGRAFAVGTALNLGFVAAELFYGFAANSLALVADAAHNFSDVVGLLMAWGAHWLSRRAPTQKHTYGYQSASILAAIANALLLLGAIVLIVAEAVHRFNAPPAIATGIVGWVAAAGIAVNAFTAFLFMRGRKNDININGAFLHMAADAAVSLGVVVGAVLIAWTGLEWIDPAISLVIAAVIFISGWDLAKKAVNLALGAVPHDIDRTQVQAYLAALPGVTEVHDLHIWAMGTTQNALTAHLVRAGFGLDDDFLHNACRDLREKFNIGHATLQVEAGTRHCDLAGEHTI